LPPDASLRLWYQKAVRLAFASLVALALVVPASACSSQTGDPPFNGGVPPVGGKDMQFKDISDPGLPAHGSYINQSQPVSGAVVTAVDTFDETADGKGTGTLYMQDIGSADPYSGMSFFATTFNPGNLRVSVGDVLDLTGTYQEATNRGPTAMFPTGSVQSQMAFAIATFRYETKAPEPLDLKAEDLADFKTARRWIGMLVRLKNVPVPRTVYTAASGRVSVDLGSLPQAGNGCDAPFPKPPQLVNDLVDLTPLNLGPNKTIKSVVGVVGFFCSIHLAPRSLADVQL
jgi:hypothetical protein